MRRLTKLFWVIMACTIWPSTAIWAQGTFPVNGMHANTPSYHYFYNCNIVQGPGQTILGGAMVIKDGLVENVGKNIQAPAGATAHDLKGFWLFPGFIDPWSTLGLDRPKKPERQGDDGSPQYERSQPGPYGWNETVKPEQKVVEQLKQDQKRAQEWRNFGYTTVNVVPNDGIIRGISAVLNLGDRSLQEELVQPFANPVLSLRKGSSNQSYPSSQMGVLALLRQSFSDANWYAELQKLLQTKPNLPPTEQNLSLLALMQQMEGKLPFLVECNEWQEVLRLQTLAKSFGLQFACKMDGEAYQRIEAMKQAGSTLLIPLSFPSAFDVSDPADAREIPLKDMWHWEAAPTNPAAVAKAKIPFAFTLSDGTKASEFWGNLQKALKYGLDQDAALAALTTVPAQLLGLEKRLGKLEAGMHANFFIADANVFVKEKSNLLETWVGGRQYIQQSIPEWDARGSYQIETGRQSIRLFIKGSLLRPKCSFVLGNDTLDGSSRINGQGIELSLPAQKGASSPQYKLIGLADAQGNLRGEGSMPDGSQFEWKANKFAAHEESQDTIADIKLLDLSDLPSPRMPFTGYGLSTAPQQGKWLIKGVTVWTNTAQGVLQDAEVLIAEGKVQGVGKGLLVPPGAIILDGTGMHITPGIIDEHSHIAISKGVNEGSHANSAEVSIADVINCEDINIYRQLSGGVTAAQLLHGSANPIGGRSAIIKLRWGATPEEMKFKEAPGFIKFALGENVKQTNWGEQFTTRYPQTRMGVEQFVKDQFQAALDYRAAQKAHAGNANGLPPRKDFQMEVLLEILDGKRFITCHSYVQSEIVMLMRVAESFGFKINTFTHILEGYKVASKLQQHGANASTFSDWWAYKYEVIDAIPYNAFLLNKAGVNVCINSDDAEMGRRLNQEAAKAVKYGGMSEEEALKMVTLNPAKTLHVDAYVGSIEKGKQADLVLWNAHPLSVYANAQKTWIDGRLYFDREIDLASRKFVQEERLRLIQKMQSSPDGDKKKFEGRNGGQLYHCDTMGYEEE